MTAVIIGAVPHKGSHTAVAIDESEKRLGRLRVPAAAHQAAKLLAWAADWPDRTWAAGGARGLGHLLDWQFVAAGETVPGHPAQAGLAGPAAAGRIVEQERPG